MATFNPNAEEIIKEQSETISSLIQERAILRSQLKEAERQIDAHEENHASAPKKRGPKAVASVPES